MFIDSYEHPKKPVEWIYRCRICGAFEETTQEEAMTVLENLYKVEHDTGK